MLAGLVTLLIISKYRRTPATFRLHLRVKAQNAVCANGQKMAPAPGNVSGFGLQHPFAANIPITSPFARNRPVPGGTADFNGTGFYDHTGIDFGAPCGTPIYAPADGKVSLAGQTNVVYGGGNVLWISHGVVQGNALMTVFYHNASVLVSSGQRVKRGQLVAYSGNTGNSTGCHAHFETWLNGTPVDPMSLL